MKFFAILILASIGCATSGAAGAGQVVGTADEPLPAEFAGDAQKAFDKGALEEKDGNPLQARRYFEHVRNKFPYSQFAVLAELALADDSFEHGHFLEAAEAYAAFARLHPKHAKVDYAAYRAALSYYKDMPSDFFLFPPAHEKDQTQVKAALNSFNDFLGAYPKSTLVDEARDKQKEIRTRLAHHEDYVGNFYYKRERWIAAANRYEALVRDYAGLGFDDEALWRLSDCAVHLGDKTRARKALEQLTKEFPASAHQAAATALLAGDLQEKVPASGG